MIENNDDEIEWSLFSLLIFFLLVGGICSIILYITKTHERAYMVAKTISKTINIEITKHGTKNIYYCFTHSISVTEDNIDCVKNNISSDDPFEQYNTIVTYFSKNGDYFQSNKINVLNYSESLVILLDGDNNNFNNNLDKLNKIYVIPSSVYTNSNKYQIFLNSDGADFNNIN